VSVTPGRAIADCGLSIAEWKKTAPAIGNRTSTSSVESQSQILTPWQYEALCRHALSREYIIPIGDIRTGYLQSPTKTGRDVRHQIDLYWTSSDGICEFLCIANAKFQKSNVTLTEIMTLLGVQRDIQAHKAVILTNTGRQESQPPASPCPEPGRGACPEPGREATPPTPCLRVPASPRLSPSRPPLPNKIIPSAPPPAPRARFGARRK
jgi:hypothetical protein